MAEGKTSPFTYVNTILSNWKNQNVFTPDKIQQPQQQVEQQQVER